MCCFSKFFQVSMSIICCFQRLVYEDVLLVFVIYDSKLRVLFGLLVGQRNQFKDVTL